MNKKPYKVEKKRDDRKNLIWRKYPSGKIQEWKYDDRNNLIWYKDMREKYFFVDKMYRKAESLDKEEIK